MKSFSSLFVFSGAALRKLWLLRYQDNLHGNSLEFKCEYPRTVCHLHVFTDADRREIEELYRRLYRDESIRIKAFVKRCKRLVLGNDMVSTASPRGVQTPYSMILARWPAVDSSIRPAHVVGLYNIELLNETSHFIAKVKWLKEHEHRYSFGRNSNLEVWCTDFLSEATFNFIPVKFITGRFVAVVQDLDVTGESNYPLVDRVNMVIALPSRSTVST